MVSLSTATLVGFILETLFYGVFLVIFGISANLQWRRHRQAPPTWGDKLVVAFSIFLCLLITTHWWLNLWGICEAFLRASTPLGRNTVLTNLGETKSITKLAVYEVQTWMGDALLIYRLYYVAGRKWPVIVPPILTCWALVTCSSHFLYYASRIDSTQPLPATVSLVRKWTIATCSLAVAENIYCLALIGLFTWKSHHDARRAPLSGLQSVLRILVESAGVWVFFISLTFIVYLFDENASYFLLYSTSPVLGISFCMMTIRPQLRSRATVLGSGHTKPTCLGNFRTVFKEQTSYTAGSVDAWKELVVVSSKQTFDTTISKV